MAFKIIKYRKDDLEFSYKVNIDQDGIFTAYLPEDIVEKFETAGIVLRCNPARKSRTGFFSHATMFGVKEQVGDVVAEYFSREKIEEKLVIRYDIQTTCSYCLDAAGKIVPNGSEEWMAADGYEWLGGTVELSSTHAAPYGILVYAKIFRKQVFEYKSGKKKSEYTQLSPNGMDKKDGEFKFHLTSFCCMSEPHKWGGNLKEIDYTEDAAEFFVNLLTSICRLNENIKNRLDPESILKMIGSKQRLLN